MKRVTATDARRSWFRLLDEVAAGEVVSIDRGGRTILLQRASAGDEPRKPDYADIISAPCAEEAHRWGWAWEEGDISLSPKDVGEDEPDP